MFSKIIFENYAFCGPDTEPESELEPKIGIST